MAVDLEGYTSPLSLVEVAGVVSGRLEGFPLKLIPDESRKRLEGLDGRRTKACAHPHDYGIPSVPLLRLVDENLIDILRERQRRGIGQRRGSLAFQSRFIP